MHLKTSKGEKVTYSLMCVFAHVKKKSRKKRNVPTMECTKYRCPHNSVNVLTPISTLTKLQGQLYKN